MSTATAQPNELQTEPAAEREPALPFRGDTFFGVFEAIGQDFGINPNWLRVPSAALLLWNPEVIVGCYLALGIAVAAARLLVPVRPRSSKVEAKASAGAAQVSATDEQAKVESEELLAA